MATRCGMFTDIPNRAVSTLGLDLIYPGDGLRLVACESIQIEGFDPGSE